MEEPNNPYLRQLRQPYVCSLDVATQEKARIELNEDPRDRLDAVEALRAWLHGQPHISMRDDTRVLLAFLRGSKFSQLRAREMIEGNASIFTAAPHWFQGIDTQDKRIMVILKRGYAVPLPKRDENGCQIILYRIGSLDASTKHMGVADEIRAGLVMGTYLAQSEMTQVCGSVFVFDFTGITAKHMTRWKLDDIRKWTKLWQNNFPGRFKAFHYYNAGTFFETMMGMVKPFMKKKFQERIHTHSTLESLYRYLPKEMLPIDYLPDDYKGEHQGVMADLINSFVNEVTSDDFRDYILYATNERFGIDESKRPQTGDVKASFRKLAVD